MTELEPRVVYDIEEEPAWMQAARTALELQEKSAADIKTLEERIIRLERLIDAAIRLAETNGNDNWYWDY